MHGFDRTYGVGAPLSLRIFDMAPRPNDLVHIFEQLAPEECEVLGRIVAKSHCWVRVSPKVGRAFASMDWLGHLSGCAKLWLDLTRDCKISASTIEGLSKDVRHLLLPYRPGSQYAAVSFQKLSQLESLTISGTFKNVAFLESLHSLRELKMFRTKVTSLHSIGNLTTLEKLVLENSRLDSLCGIEQASSLTDICILNTQIKAPCDLSRCLGVAHLEIVSSKFGGALALPNSKLKSLRLIAVSPAVSLGTAWAISSLETLANDAGILELQQGVIPAQHPTLKQLYIGSLDRLEATRFSRILGVKVVCEEGQMPPNFG